MAMTLIILAEDNPKLRRLYTDYLSASGYLVLDAASGAEALEILSSHTPDIVILDIMMPGIDGIETCRQMREVLGDGIPIIFLTAVDDPDRLRSGIEAGGDDYVLKSGALETIRARVEYWSQPEARDELVARRAKNLAEVASATSESDAAAAAPKLSSATDETVRWISAFVDRAKSVAQADFGSTVEEKIYLLGYITGAVNHWVTLKGEMQKRFTDYLSAVLVEAKILDPTEIRQMVAALSELSENKSFKNATQRGRAECVQALQENDNTVPTGLADYRKVIAA